MGELNEDRGFNFHTALYVFSARDQPARTLTHDDAISELTQHVCGGGTFKVHSEIDGKIHIELISEEQLVAGEHSKPGER